MVWVLSSLIVPVEHCSGVKGGSLESESSSSEGKGVSVTTEGVLGTMKAGSGGEWYSSWVSVEPSDGICLITFCHEISSLSWEAFNCLRTQMTASLIAVSMWECAKDSISRDRSLDRMKFQRYSSNDPSRASS